MKDISDEKFKIFEIYPYVHVYRDVFKDINKTYQLLKDSYENQGAGLLNNWSQWSTFGEYLNPPMMPEKHPRWNPSPRLQNVDLIETSSEVEKEHQDFMIEVLDLFYQVTEDYINKNNVDVNLEAMSKDENGNDTNLWRVTGPSICRYQISDSDKPVAMTYHSDYIRHEGEKPGYKFAITALAYFNDDYEGGEIDFVIDNKLVKYKPQAGDYLVFPSGHPEILTEDGIVYLHGVMPIKNGHKYFSRMYWQKYYEGSENWHAKEKEFGKEAWLAMQPALEKQFIAAHPQRFQIEDGVRLQ